MNDAPFLKQIINGSFLVGLYELVWGYTPYRNFLVIASGLFFFVQCSVTYFEATRAPVNCIKSISIDNPTGFSSDDCQIPSSDAKPPVAPEDSLKISVLYPDQIQVGGKATLKLKVEGTEPITISNIFITLETMDPYMDIGDSSLENSSVFTREVPFTTPTATPLSPTAATTSPPTATATPSPVNTPTPLPTLTPTPLPTPTPLSVCPVSDSALSSCEAATTLVPIDTLALSPTVTPNPPPTAPTVSPTSILSPTMVLPKSWSKIYLEYGHPCYPRLIRSTCPVTTSIGVYAEVNYLGHGSEPMQSEIGPMLAQIQVVSFPFPIEVLSLVGIALGPIITIMNFWQQIRGFLIRNVVGSPEAPTSNGGQD